MENSVLNMVTPTIVKLSWTELEPYYLSFNTFICQELTILVLTKAQVGFCMPLFLHSLVCCFSPTITVELWSRLQSSLARIYLLLWFLVGGWKSFIHSNYNPIKSFFFTNILDKNQVWVLPPELFPIKYSVLSCLELYNHTCVLFLQNLSFTFCFYMF